ncbi:hypothetical protein N9X65_06215 [Porticoccaceae bacterium]|nr:hypothetical protein [Porticoccaceae bacterium]
MSRLKVVYIAGLYHSGSTVLDMSLGAHREIVGLGECYKLIYDGHENLCSCGVFPNRCEYWSRVKLHDSDYASSYENIKTAFRSQFPELLLLDSSKCHPLGPLNKSASKSMKGLNYWIKQNDVELKVIHLTRDALTWAARINQREKRFIPKSGRFSRMYRRLVASVPVRLIQWSVGHKSIETYCRMNNVDVMQVSYEKICSQTEEALSEICDFIDVQFDSSMLIPNNTNSHITVGNPVRHTKNARSKLTFDVRPLFNFKSLFTLVTFYFLQNQNSKYFNNDQE